MAGQTQAIPKDWKETTLGEVVEKIIDNRGKTPLFNLEKGYKLIETWQISIDSKYPTTEKNKQKFVDKQTYNQWFRSGHPQNGDILFSTVGESVPQFCFAPEEERICIAQNLIGIRTNRNLVDAPFLLSLFKTRKFILSVKNRLIITAQPSIKVPHLLGVEIILPPLPEQYAIASVLSSLDDKIELLHEQNKTLEATTQAIFTEWFTIPLKGWKVRRLGEVTRVVGGTTPSTKNAKFWNGGIHWTSPKDLSNSRDLFLLNTEKKITTKGLAQISSGLLPKGTLLLSSRAPIGYLAITNIELAINQGYIALLPDSYFSNYFMYLWLKRNMQEVINSANGSTFLEISKGQFKHISCIIPDRSILDKFQLVVNPIFAKILRNQLQIQTLSKVRDTLLPKLMKGDVRVK